VPLVSATRSHNRESLTNLGSPCRTSALPGEDIEAFETAIENGVFHENIEEFSTCFDLNLRRATIDEIVYDE
jgi:hypothetical protein